MTASDGMVAFYKRENQALRQKLEEQGEVLEEAKVHVIDLVNTFTVEPNSDKMTISDQTAVVRKAETWLKEKAVNLL
jgi:hypothetical protein